jgi:hypothetical protein
LAEEGNAEDLGDAVERFAVLVREREINATETRLYNEALTARVIS